MNKDDNKKTHIIVTGKGGGGGSNAGAVRFDEAQTLTSAEQLQARENIGVPTEWFGTQAEYDLIDPKDPNTVYHIEGSDNVQADWNQTDTTADDYIKNKPSIPAAQVNSDWNAASGVAQILNKPLVIETEYPSETLTFTLAGGETRTVKFLTQPTGYFYVEDVSDSDNTLRIKKNGSTAPTVEVFYSTDQQNWTSMGQTSTTAITATVPANGRLYLKAVTNGWSIVQGNWGDVKDWIRINCELPFNVGGNIMSLIYGNSFMNKPEFLTGNRGNVIAFANLFKEANIVSAANLILPATTLQTSCYQGMFSNCHNLTTAPALPATTLSISCYTGMFNGCTSLTQAPTLPATTLTYSCYAGMFVGCTSLTEAPALPAPRLAAYCYELMFVNCTNLNKIVCYCEHPDSSAMGGWLSNVSPTGDFYNLGGATYESGASGIPTGWTEHTSL